MTRQWAFLDHAAVAPISGRAAAAIARWSDDVVGNGGVNTGAWWREIEAARVAAARLINAEASEIAWVGNTSYGLAQVAEGFPWQSGDNVVVTAGEYPANVYPWMHLASRGVETRIVPPRGARILVEDLEAAIDSRTRLLTLSFVQYHTGFRSDLDAVGAVCHARGVDFCVDAIQGLGVLPIDVQSSAIDYLAADGHKWLLGPEGAGLLYVRRERLGKLRPVSVGWKSIVNDDDFGTVDYRLKDDARKFEPGTFNTPGIVGLGASVKLLAEVGIDAIAAQVRAITDYLVDRLAGLDAEIVSPRRPSEWSGIVSFTLPGKDPRELVQRCRQQQVAISCRCNRLRASPHFYNNRDDIDRLMAALAS